MNSLEDMNTIHAILHYYHSKSAQNLVFITLNTWSIHQYMPVLMCGKYQYCEFLFMEDVSMSFLRSSCLKVTSRIISNVLFLRGSSPHGIPHKVECPWPGGGQTEVIDLHLICLTHCWFPNNNIVPAWSYPAQSLHWHWLKTHCLR